MIRDEDFYGAAADELASGRFAQGLMAKAYALALGDAEKTKALYIGLRADQLKEGAAAALAEAAVRQHALAVETERQARRAQERRRAEEKRQRAEEEAARKKAQDEEAARAAQAWNRESSRREAWIQPPPPPSSKPHEAPPSDVPLDEMIESMKKAQEATRWRSF